MTLIRSVTCSVLRVACCVELLHHVSLPWSETAAGLIHDCLLLDTANAGELQSLHDLLQLKAMLHDRYGVTDFNFSDANTGHVSELLKWPLFYSLSISLSLPVALHPTYTIAGTSLCPS